MELRNLGKTGIKVSIVGLGCNNFGWKADLEGSRSIIDAALANGINFLDTSDSYGPSEDFIGEVLGARRKDIVLATKFGSPLDEEGKKKGASRAYIAQAVESSLKRLKTDWIDLYQLHFPDPETPIEETLRALDDLVRQGKVRAIGCSNLTGAMLREAMTVAADNGLTPFATTQNEYNLLFRGMEAELGDLIVEHGLGVLPYFPLANGVLTGKYKPGQPAPAGARLADAPAFFDPYKDPAKWELAARLEAFAVERGHSLIELAFSWLAAQPGVASIIAGASRPEQAAQNAGAAGWKLSATELAEIDRMTAAA
ncbi:MAG: aldo/keto reductase [Sphingomonas sp.]|nr:aldo/keto reductase [Sphingomonas sp.]MDX3886004.1 aldo/keto reductase [Sphingomonas sp.]